VPKGGHFFPISDAAIVMGWLKPFLGITEETAAASPPGGTAQG